VVAGKVEFRLDVQVTGEAEIGLFPLQEVFSDLGSMDLMTVITPDRTQFVDTPLKLEERLLFIMTRKAGIGLLFRILIFEGKDEPLSLCLRMFTPWAMAGFTPFLVRENPGIKHIFPVGIIFPEGIVEVWMAPFAGLRLHISFLLGLLGLHLLLAKRGETNEGYRSH